MKMEIKEIQRILKKSLLMSNEFMQLWKNPEKYRKFIEKYTKDVNNNGYKKVYKEYSQDYYLNDYDFETINKDYHNLKNGKSLSNETGFQGKGNPDVGKEGTPQESNESTEGTESESDAQMGGEEAGSDMGVDEKSDTTEQYEDMVHFQEIPIKQIGKGDIIDDGSDYMVVMEKKPPKVRLQNIFKPSNRYNIDMRKYKNINVLTDESVEFVLKDFIQENMWDNLPNILKRQYDYLLK